MSNSSAGRRARPASADEDPNVDTCEYASPPCLMHELDPAARGPLPAAELVALLESLLAAARRRARTTTLTAAEVLEDPELLEWLVRLARDERRCARLLCAALRRLDAGSGALSSTADEPLPERDVALVRRLWSRLDDAVRRLRAAVPRIDDTALHALGSEILAAHENNRDECTRMLIAWRERGGRGGAGLKIASEW